MMRGIIVTENVSVLLEIGIRVAQDFRITCFCVNHLVNQQTRAIPKENLRSKETPIRIKCLRNNRMFQNTNVMVLTNTSL